MPRLASLKQTMRILWQYHHKHLTLSIPPKIMTVEVTNACNLNCLWCARDATKKRGIGIMTQPTFDRILEFCRQTHQNSLQLFMHGESTLHPDFIDFLAQAEHLGIATTFTTNGVLVTKTYGQQLLDAGLRSVCFSFEGTSKEAYEMIRRGADYDVVKRNIRDFIATRNQYGSLCRVKLSILDCEYTHDGLNAFIREWQGLVDDIIVVPLHDWGGVLGKDVDTSNHKGPEVCFFPWYGFAVYWNGNIAPCCMYEGDMGLGNIHDTGIMRLWNSDAYQSFRDKMLHDRESLPICNECREHFFRRHPIYKHLDTPNWHFPLDSTGLSLGCTYAKRLVK